MADQMMNRVYLHARHDLRVREGPIRTTIEQKATAMKVRV